MSLPGIFTPIRSGDHLYADGGLLNNIPIDVAKGMRADGVLGIHLEVAPLSPKANLPSYGVLGQAVTVMIAANELRSMEQADILVTVPLQKYDALDYDKAEAIIKAGYDAAASKASVLSAFSVSEAEWEQYLAIRKSRTKVAPAPTFVQVAGATPEAAKAMEEQMSPLVGQPVDPKKIDENMMDIAGQRRFSTSTYSMVEKNGEPGLQIEVEPKSYAPPIVRPLILIDGSDYNNVLLVLELESPFWTSEVTDPSCAAT